MLPQTSFEASKVAHNPQVALAMLEAYSRVLTMQAGQAEVDELLDMCTHFEHASSAIHALAVDCRVQQFVANPLVQVRLEHAWHGGDRNLLTVVDGWASRPCTIYEI